MSGAWNWLSSLGSSRPDRRYSNAAGPSQSDGLAATSARISASERTWPTSPTRQSEGLADLGLYPFHVEPRAPFFQHGLSQHPPPMFMGPIGLGQASSLPTIPYQECHGETGQGASNHDSDGLGEHLACSMDVSPGSYGSSGSNPPADQRAVMATAATKNAEKRTTDEKKENSRRQEQCAASPGKTDRGEEHSTQDTMGEENQLYHSEYLQHTDHPEPHLGYPYPLILDEVDFHNHDRSDRGDRDYRGYQEDEDWDMCN